VFFTYLAVLSNILIWIDLVLCPYTDDIEDYPVRIGRIAAKEDLRLAEPFGGAIFQHNQGGKV